jgi:hypothetical protein
MDYIDQMNAEANYSDGCDVGIIQERERCLDICNQVALKFTGKGNHFRGEYIAELISDRIAGVK